MKTRLVLLILCTLSFLQVQTGCVENNKRREHTTAPAKVEKTVPQAEESAEQMTEDSFYKFVQELSVGNQSSGTLVCNKFPNKEQAFSFIITLFGSDAERKAFAEKSEYESAMLKLEYTEEKVEGGFAELIMEFKQRKGESLYTVIFVPGNK